MGGCNRIERKSKILCDCLNNSSKWNLSCKTTQIKDADSVKVPFISESVRFTVLVKIYDLHWCAIKIQLLCMCLISSNCIMSQSFIKSGRNQNRVLRCTWQTRGHPPDRPTPPTRAVSAGHRHGTTSSKTTNQLQLPRHTAQVEITTKPVSLCALTLQTHPYSEKWMRDVSRLHSAPTRHRPKHPHKSSFPFNRDGWSTFTSPNLELLDCLV